MEEEKTSQIELRSEKVRNIIGRIPSVFVRYGTLMIVLALFILIVVAAFVPYRETIPVKITIAKSNAGLTGKSAVSKSDVTKISLGNKIVINDQLLGHLEGSIVEISPQPLSENGYKREITMCFTQQTLQKDIHPGDVMDGQIVLSDIPVLKKFLLSLGITHVFQE